MEFVRSSLEHIYIIPKAIFRLCFIIVNNAYCIPTYVVWMLLLTPLRKINPDTYWRIEGYVFHWLLAMVSTWSWSAGYDVVETGDDITDCLDERTLVLSNHQSTADVPLLMACFNTKKNLLPNLMWIMDSLFKYTNFGVVSVLHQDFFIMSGKDKRDQSIKELVRHLLESYIPRRRKWMVLFPEGGFLRKRRAISQKYAEKNNLPILQNVSLPRVGAMTAIMNTVGPGRPSNNNSDTVDDLLHDDSCKLAWILDITIAYPNGEPLDLKSILFGHRAPCRTTLYYRLYPCKDVPRDGDALAQWLYKRFEEKDRMLEAFYRTGKFPLAAATSPSSPDGQLRSSTSQATHLVTQDCLRFLVLHLFFITSTYVHVRMFLAAYNYCNTLLE